jgi:hypothetical protein
MAIVRTRANIDAYRPLSASRTRLILTMRCSGRNFATSAMNCVMSGTISGLTAWTSDPVDRCIAGLLDGARVGAHGSAMEPLVLIIWLWVGERFEEVQIPHLGRTECFPTAHMRAANASAPASRR